MNPMTSNASSWKSPLRGSLACFAAAALLAGCLASSRDGGGDGSPPPGSVWESRKGSNAAELKSRMAQAASDFDAKSKGCLASGCHEGVEPAHARQTVQIGCTDCHGGDGQATAKEKAHVLPADPARAAQTASVHEDAEWVAHPFDYVRFVNPGDLRVADATCGPCHASETYASKKSMMAHGAMLWGTVLYNNGSYPLKRPRFGEAYGPDGKAIRLQTIPAPTDEEVTKKGVLPYLDPLPRYNIGQMGNILRVFERGTTKPLELGNPNKDEDPGLPARRLSFRGLGTQLRTDPVYLGVTKTRLLDPTLWMPGSPAMRSVICCKVSSL